MIENYLNIPADKLLEAAGQTIYMLGISLFFGTLIGIPLGLLLVLTRKNGIKANHTIHFLVSGLVNIVRSAICNLISIYCSANKSAGWNKNRNKGCNCSISILYCTIFGSFDRKFYIRSSTGNFRSC